MKLAYWLTAAAVVVPLLACSDSSDESAPETQGAAGGPGVVVGDPGSQPPTGGDDGIDTGEDTGSDDDTGSNGTGTDDSATPDDTPNCPVGMVELNAGGQCMCALPCTAGDDAACAEAMEGAHCCDFSAAGYGALCGADQESPCDAVIGMQCGGGGGGGGGAGGGLACDALTQGQSPDCDTCAASNCVGQCGTCNSNTDCLGMLSCMAGCSDQACADECAAQYPNGVGDMNGFIGCLQTSECTACFGG